jgi:hypothetical protein
MPVQHWSTAPEVGRVAGLRREVVAFAAEQRVPDHLLADLAIGVSAVLGNVVRSTCHRTRGNPRDGSSVTISVDVDEDRMVACVSGPRAETLDRPGAGLGLVTAASLACDIHVLSEGDDTEISMTFPQPVPTSAENGRPVAATVPHRRFTPLPDQRPA